MVSIGISGKPLTKLVMTMIYDALGCQWGQRIKGPMADIPNNSNCAI